MPHCIRIIINVWDIVATDVFLVCFPGNACLVELGEEVGGRALMVAGGGAIVANAEIRPRNEPDIVRFAG